MCLPFCVWFVFFGLYLLYPYDKVSLCLFIFWWMSSKMTLESQTAVLFESVLSEISFGDPAFLLQFDFKWSCKRIAYLCEQLAGLNIFFWTFLYWYLSPQKKIKTTACLWNIHIVWEGCVRKYTCVLGSKSSLGSMSSKEKGRMAIE